MHELRPKDEDVQLVDRVLAGETQAFETLVRRHERRVFRTTLAVAGNSEDAEEAMQDTFVKAYQHLGEFRRDSRFSTWLTRIAINEGLQRRRRHRDQASLDDPENGFDPPAPRRLEEWSSDPEKRYAAQERKRLVEGAIRSLPAAYRVVVVLRDIEELPAEEAAEVLGLSLPALKSRLLRGRLMLRERLAPHFELPPSFERRLRRAGKMMRHMIEMGLERMAGR